jgi:histidyl-tRNA synthetase
VKVASIKGFRDVLPDEAELRRRIVERSMAVLHSYGYREIEVPMMENAELFRRTVGATTDIVEKEMYAFEDRDESVIALRPEGTASVVRAYLEAGLARAMPVARLFYYGPMFRRERPQKGRFRQFTQIGAEFIGRDDPETDTETICLVDDICRAARLGPVRIEVNSLGDAACRPAYREALIEYGRGKLDELCADCKNRIERNPLRLLDCKNESCRAATEDAPMMIDHLCESCAGHHAAVLELVKAAGVTVHANPRMVRGLDYYCKTAFEISAEGLGAQGAVGGGGRYDGLVAQLGGADLPGIGFAFGLERMQLAAEAAGDAEAPAGRDSILVAPIGAAARGPALLLARRLRGALRVVELGQADRKLKAQLKRADKIGARWVVIVGDDELASGKATVRDLVGHFDRTGCFSLRDDAQTMLASMENAEETPGEA